MTGSSTINSTLKGVFDTTNTVVFLTEQFEGIDSRSKCLYEAIRLQTGVSAEILRSKKKHKEGHGLDGDLNAKDGKHYLLIREGVIKGLNV